MNNYGCHDNMHIRLKVHKSWCGKHWVLLCGNRKFLKKYTYLKIKELYYLTIFTKCKLVFRILLKNILCTFKKEKTNINCQIQLRWFIIFGLIDLMIHNLILRELKLHGLLHLSMLISWWAMLPLVEYERTEYAVRLLQYTDR